MREDNYTWKEKVLSSMSDMLNFKCQYYIHRKVFSRVGNKELNWSKKTRDGINVIGNARIQGRAETTGVRSEPRQTALWGTLTVKEQKKTRRLKGQRQVKKGEKIPGENNVSRKSNGELQLKGPSNTPQHSWVINQERSEDKLSKLTIPRSLMQV